MRVCVCLCEGVRVCVCMCEGVCVFELGMCVVFTHIVCKCYTSN